jgi:hypothetical protein
MDARTPPAIPNHIIRPVSKQAYKKEKLQSSYLIFMLMLLIEFIQGAVMVVWELDLSLPVQSLRINIKVVSSNPAHGELYSIQHYVIKFVSDLQQVCDFLLVLRFPPSIKLEVVLNPFRIHTYELFLLA